LKKYEGTRLGRQEIEAELLDDVPGALWTRAMIDAARAPLGFVLPALTRIVVAIDPAATSGEDADETGIVVAGKDKDGRGYVLADLSGRYPPTEWAKVAIAAYKAHRADRVVAEINLRKVEPREMTTVGSETSSRISRVGRGVVVTMTRGSLPPLRPSRRDHHTSGDCMSIAITGGCLCSNVRFAIQERSARQPIVIALTAANARAAPSM